MVEIVAIVGGRTVVTQGVLRRRQSLCTRRNEPPTRGCPHIVAQAVLLAVDVCAPQPHPGADAVLAYVVTAQIKRVATDSRRRKGGGREGGWRRRQGLCVDASCHGKGARRFA